MATEVTCCGTKFILYVLVIIGLVCFAGLMAGLTLGLMSLGLVDLEVLMQSGRPQDRIHAGILRFLLFVAVVHSLQNQCPCKKGSFLVDMVYFDDIIDIWILMWWVHDKACLIWFLMPFLLLVNFIYAISLRGLWFLYLSLIIWALIALLSIKQFAILAWVYSEIFLYWLQNSRKTPFKS